MKLLNKIFRKKTDQTAKELETLKRKIAVLEQRRYEAAQSPNTLAGWVRTPASADSIVKNDLASVRTRARNSERNEPISKRYVTESIINIPGAYGFALHMQVSDIVSGRKKLNREINLAIAEAWKDWRNKRNYEITGRLSGRKIEHLVTAGLCRDGEALLMLHRNKSKYGLQVEILDPELLDETYTQELPNGNTVIMGIEFDKMRRHVAYHLKVYNPIQASYGHYQTKDRKRIPASNIIYLYDATLPLQSRGMSPMSASLVRIKKMSQYESASVTNAISRARRLGFITSEETAEDSYNGATTRDEKGNRIDEIDEASVYELLPNQKYDEPDVHYPHSQHEMFMKSAGRIVSTGLSMDYGTLFNDMGEANYSSMRVGMLSTREYFALRQEDIIEDLCEPLFTEWLTMASLNNAIKLPKGAPDITLNFEYYNRPYFIGRTWKWIDPESDTNARTSELGAGFTSPQRIASEQGNDWREVYEEIQEANEYAAKLGITIDLTGKQPPQPAQPTNGTGTQNKNGKAVPTTN